ncbi:MAG: hypothetical protein JWP87_405 [Labilithrix sp.]|nr:hypothetical protein [Labilithrix sp.]
MGLRALSACAAASLAMIVACGGGGDGAPSDDNVGGTIAPSNPSASLEKAGGQCASDADCPTGFTCVSVSLGEFVQRSCVAPSDAGPPKENQSAEGGADDDAKAPDAAIDASYSCSNPLVVTITSVLPNPRPKCFLNTTVDTSSAAVLGFVCGGGNASVTFGAQTFTGTDTNGTVTVTNKSQYPMSSTYLGGVTCKIDAVQTITGTLASGTLAYSYSETFAPGQSSICPLAFQLCSATGSAAVK